MGKGLQAGPQRAWLGTRCLQSLGTQLGPFRPPRPLLSLPSPSHSSALFYSPRPARPPGWNPGWQGSRARTDPALTLPTATPQVQSFHAPEHPLQERKTGVKTTPSSRAQCGSKVQGQERGELEETGLVVESVPGSLDLKIYVRKDHILPGKL